VVSVHVEGLEEVLRRVVQEEVAPLREALVELLGSEGERSALADAAAKAAATTYSWDRIAAQTLDLYRGLL
jgi:glycosyltransferase involved in cell wall biosynthesis